MKKEIVLSKREAATVLRAIRRLIVQQHWNLTDYYDWKELSAIKGLEGRISDYLGPTICDNLEE